MHTATIDDIHLAYHDQGQGRTVLFIHAFPLNSSMWQPQIDALSDQFRLIAPDLRGFGQSELGTPPVSLERYSDDLAVLLDTLQIDKATLVGLSMGGYIAFAMLERFRDRIEALVLADTRAGADSDEAREGRFKNAQLAESKGTLAVGEPMLAKLLASGAPDSLRSRVLEMMRANQGDGVAAALRSMAARPDSTALLETITVPTLVIVGSEDAITPSKEAHTIHAGIKDSQLLELPGTGHLSNLEAPDAFTAALRSFLSGGNAQLPR